VEVGINEKKAMIFKTSVEYKCLEQTCRFPITKDYFNLIVELSQADRDEHGLKYLKDLIGRSLSRLLLYDKLLYPLFVGEEDQNAWRIRRSICYSAIQGLEMDSNKIAPSDRVIEKVNLGNLFIIQAVFRATDLTLVVNGVKSIS
jgi:hypothetical protein